MTRSPIPVRLLPVLVLSIIVFAACSGAGSAPTSGGGGNGGGAPQPGATVATGGDQDGNAASPSAAPREPDIVGGAAAPAPQGPEIVYTGTLQLSVENLDEALTKARTAIVGIGGYIGASQLSTSEERRFASVTYRIPAERWEDGLDALRKLGKVEEERTDAAEVADQIVDLEARIANLRATERTIQAIMDRATEISDILQIQAQLTSVRGEIERMDAQRANLEGRAALATLTVSYSVPVVAVAQTQTGWDAKVELDRALAQLVGMGQVLASIAIWLGVVGLPILAGGLLVLLVGRVVTRRVRAAGLPTGTNPG
jgi:hypothetical protein